MGSLGISLVVTLTAEEPLPPSWFDRTGVTNVFVPVQNFFPPSVDQVDEILGQVAEVAGRGSKIMIHCGGGKGRAGTVAACLLLRYGLGGLRAAIQSGKK